MAQAMLPEFDEAWMRRLGYQIFSAFRGQLLWNDLIADRYRAIRKGL